MKNISFIGAGRLAQALSRALLQAGWPVTRIASRNPESAAKLAAQLPGSQAVPVAEAAQCDGVFLTVPDDMIASLVGSLPWRDHQKVFHCSGATEISALEAATLKGARTGSFHPLQIFSSPGNAMKNLKGCSVAIEGDPGLRNELAHMAETLGMYPLRLPAGARPLYHAAAGYAASMIIALFHEAVEIWAQLGLSETQSLKALLPLARGTLDAIEERDGLAGALSGPVSRGDASVLQRHLTALDHLDARHGEIYRALTKHQIAIAQSSGRLGSEQIEILLTALKQRERR